MAWYDDDTRRTYVATYTDERSMRADIEAAARFGFIAQATTRAGKKWTITYHRDEQTRARVRLEKILSQLSMARTNLDQTKSKIDMLQRALADCFQSARTGTSSPTKLEQVLLKAVTDVIAARQTANRQREALLAAFASLRMIRDEASALQVSIPQANIDVESVTDPIRTEIAEETNRLQRANELQQVEQSVVKAVQEWQKVVGDKWGAHGKLMGAEKKATTTNMASAALGPTSATTVAPKTTAADAKHATQKARLETLEILLRQREAILLRELETRDARMAVVVS